LSKFGFKLIPILHKVHISLIHDRIIHVPLEIGTSPFLCIAAEKGSSEHDLVVAHDIVFDMKVSIELEDPGFESGAVAIVVVRPG
jgi:hypothetical protein